ncbi:hypothetical protein GFS31_34970 [Leptolyngbya sp. BL0902]|uniref:hypothetical protein n=1 Tax=Leptolyngbya sp. BL0902 TaxID=1115757 RepID=UPI0018E72078|nr:hypothetical protein [Leptolyngbya sp. BL0902]QQE66794.1 hypothetical protein GFS31_34970 [Leptolyngbya sp. BL0902]
MATLLLSATSDHGAASRPSMPLYLSRIATALAALVGIWAMASQEASSQVPGLADGTYLYGESPVAETVGATYFVFEVSGTQLTGAAYQVSSSFDCVYGTVTPSALDLTIVDAYDQTEWPHRVALLPGEATVAGMNGGAPLPTLEGMSPIAQLSPLDHDLLAACRMP